MSRLWAPWRMTYVGSQQTSSGCIFCEARDAVSDRERLVLLRAPRAFLILNAYPYTCGHVMAVVDRHIATLGDATPDEITDAFALVRRATAALTAEYRTDGFNIGINQGRVAGAGIEDHLHVHVVPRWNGDSNFMAVVGEVRVLPESLDRTWERLRGRLGG